MKLAVKTTYYTREYDSNNNPTNIQRMPADEHLALHRKHATLTCDQD